MNSRKTLLKYLKQPKIKRLYNKVRAEFEKRGPIAHNWDHIYRDLLNAIRIGEAESADMNIVVPAVILHDVGFLYNPSPEGHPELGAKKCFEWLKDWPKEEQKRIADCIRVHKGSPFGDNDAISLEVKVVSDADLLEKVGYIGILQGLRTFVEFGETCEPEFKSLYNIADLLSKPRKLEFYTATAVALSKKRGNYVRRTIFEKAMKELEEYRGQ